MFVLLLTQDWEEWWQLPPSLGGHSAVLCFCRARAWPGAAAARCGGGRPDSLPDTEADQELSTGPGRSGARGPRVHAPPAGLGRSMPPAAARRL